MSENLADYRNVLVIVGRGSRGPKAISGIQALAANLSEQLAIPVLPAFLEFGAPNLTEALEQVGSVWQANHAIVLPLFQTANPFLRARIPQLIVQANQEWPGTYFYLSASLDAQRALIPLLLQSLGGAAQTLSVKDASTTAMLMVGRGSADPNDNAEMYRHARLLWEAQRPAPLCSLSEVAFYNHTTPDIRSGLERCIRLGAERIIVLPQVLFDGSIADRLIEQVENERASHPSCEIVIGKPIETQPKFIEALISHYFEMKQAALETAVPALPLGFSHAIELSHNGHSHGIQGLLPPRYHNQEVSAAPMAAVDLKFDMDNQVAWDQMWQGFCDLAMAGGPPHRGDLLEPVSPQDVMADPVGYEQVLAELERGIRLVTGLQTVRSKSPGWVGVECTSEEMALWLLRAIIVENVSVRREDCVLYLPAGPGFRLGHEIKNVITVIAKTHHYWKEHLQTT